MRAIKRGEPGSTSCVVNPRMQRESVCIDIEGARKDAPRNILVVGAGLAGLEAARAAAFSGHHVTLCESRGWIGGQMRFAAMIPGRHEIGDIVPWYERQLAKYGVEIRLDTEIGVRELAALEPDLVIVATGSVPVIPQNMLHSVYNAGTVELAMIDDILEHGVAPGRNILVIGGDQIGLQAADFLSEGGSTVTVAEAGGKFAQKLAANDRWYLTARLIKKNVRRIKNVRAVEIDADENVSLVLDQGAELPPDIDMIVFAADRRSIRSVGEFAKDAGIETYTVGDARDVVTEDSGTIFANIAEAYDLARRL
jgi:NADPH-dependent 2,4-dienoyl-CoA reductase/sulfur reductase-like enzyme